MKKMSEEKGEKTNISSLETYEKAERAFEEAFFKDSDVYKALKTLFMQDVEAWKEAQRRDIDVKDSFRVMRLGDEGGLPHFHVFTTSGREEGVRGELKTIRTSRFIVDNKAVESAKGGEVIKLDKAVKEAYEKSVEESYRRCEELAKEFKREAEKKAKEILRRLEK